MLGFELRSGAAQRAGKHECNDDDLHMTGARHRCLYYSSNTNRRSATPIDAAVSDAPSRSALHPARIVAKPKDLHADNLIAATVVDDYPGLDLLGLDHPPAAELEVRRVVLGVIDELHAFRFHKRFPAAR